MPIFRLLGPIGCDTLLCFDCIFGLDHGGTRLTKFCRLCASIYHTILAKIAKRVDSPHIIYVDNFSTTKTIPNISACFHTILHIMASNGQQRPAIYTWIKLKMLTNIAQQSFPSSSYLFLYVLWLKWTKWYTIFFHLQNIASWFYDSKCKQLIIIAIATAIGGEKAAYDRNGPSLSCLFKAICVNSRKEWSHKLAMIWGHSLLCRLKIKTILT